MSRARLGLIWLAVVALVWRVAVLVDLRNSPLLGDDATQGDINLIVARSLMGFVFLACGVLVLAKTANKRSSVFSLYAICASLHWGGPLYAGNDQLQVAIWLLYFTLSAMLAESAFLHFTLVFPEPWKWGPRHATRFLIYLPVAVGVVAAAMAILSTPDQVAEGWSHKYFILEGLQTNIFAAAGLIILVVRYIRDRSEDGPRMITGPMAFGAWLSVLPWAVVMALESQGVLATGASDIWTLFFVLMPLSFAWAILKHRPAITVRRE